MDLRYCGARYYYDALKGSFNACDPRAGEYSDWSPFVYTLDNPLKYIDPDGQAVDAVVDAGSIVYDVGDIIYSAIWGGGVKSEHWLALGADVGALFIPGLTGAGIMVRAGSKVDDVAKLAKSADKAADAGKSTKAAKEGIYDANATSGKRYVGQSKNIDARLDRQVKSGKISPQEAAKANTKVVPGGKTAREIAEQKRINELGGIKNLENKRNPIGERRRHLLDEPQR